MGKSLSILVHLKRQKKDAQDKIPLYVRVTIDGDNDEFSLSRKVLAGEWNQANKNVRQNPRKPN
jgi:hypothetical protein